MHKRRRCECGTWNKLHSFFFFFFIPWSNWFTFHFRRLTHLCVCCVLCVCERVIVSLVQSAHPYLTTANAPNTYPILNSFESSLIHKWEKFARFHIVHGFKTIYSSVLPCVNTYIYIRIGPELVLFIFGQTEIISNAHVNLGIVREWTYSASPNVDDDYDNKFYR